MRYRLKTPTRGGTNNDHTPWPPPLAVWTTTPFVYVARRWSLAEATKSMDGFDLVSKERVDSLRTASRSSSCRVPAGVVPPAGWGRFVLIVTFLRRNSSLSGTDESGDAAPLSEATADLVSCLRGIRPLARMP